MIILKKIIRKLKYLYALNIERLPYVHWFNPVQTFYVNLKCLPLRQALKFPVFMYGWSKLYSLYGSMECVGKCRIGMVKFNKSEVDAPCYSSGNAELNLWGKIVFRGNVEVCSGTKIMVRERGLLDIGDGARIMHQCNIASFKSVKIGSNSWISHRSQIFDSNFHYVADSLKKSVSPMSKEISIGDDCWICNSVTISFGSVLPNRSIVASHSLVNKDFGSECGGTVFGGIPAKIVSRNRYRVLNSSFERQLVLYFSADLNNQDFQIPDHFLEEDF